MVVDVDLEKKLFGDFEMRWPFRNKKKKVLGKGPADPSRRAFLKKGSRLAAGAFAATSGIGMAVDFLNPKEAEARRSHKNINYSTWNHGKVRETELPQSIAPSWVVCPLAGQKGLPPGFEMSSDAIRLAASAWYAPYKNEKELVRNFDAMKRYLGLSNEMFQDDIQVSKDDKKNNPATYFLIALLNPQPWEYATGSYGGLHKTDQMVDCVVGMGNLINMILRGEKMSPFEMREMIKKPLLRSIVKCAGYNPTEAEKFVNIYVNSTEEDEINSKFNKQAFLSGIVQNISKTNVRNKRIAVWCANTLANYTYEAELGRPEILIIKNNLEIPLRKKTGIRIRSKKNEPKYYSKII